MSAPYRGYVDGGPAPERGRGRGRGCTRGRTRERGPEARENHAGECGRDLGGMLRWGIRAAGRDMVVAKTFLISSVLGIRRLQ